jgi:TolB-like protein/DNA-binding winged helix-turn-helix (wHTH) protein/thioredoxin-like negative regulator of GroEL
MKSFQGFCLDTANQCLWRGQERVAIPPKPYDMLRYLVENPGRLVTQDELLEKLWPETYVNPELIRKYIQDIRKILGDRPDKPEFIETVTKRGYRFIVPVVDESAAKTQDSNRSYKTGEQTIEENVEHEAVLSGQERSPLKRSLWKFVLIPVLAVVAGAGIGLEFRHARNAPNVPSSNNTSIAVLPFADLSPGKDQEYFSDGLAEQLIHDLAKVPRLKVVGRSSAFQFKGKNEDLREVGRKLGVANILEGSVRREGNHVRITADLIKADDGFQLWSQTYDREMNDIFAVQEEIAGAATGALQVKLLNASGPAISVTLRNTSPEAYQAYLQGQYFNGRGVEKADLATALNYANQAIQLDKNYAPAWALRSYVVNWMAGYDLMDQREGYRRARADAQQAIALDSNLAAGYLALGWVQMKQDWDWKSTEASLNKAAELEPGSVEVLRYRADLYRTLGRLDEAIDLQKQVVALDPLRARSHAVLGNMLFETERYEEAQATLQKMLELNPEQERDHFRRGQLLLAEGQVQNALAEMEQEPREDWRSFGEALAYHAAGRPQESDTALKQLMTIRPSGWAYQIAEVYAYRGEVDKAFDWMDRAYQQRDRGLLVVKSDWLIKNLRQDPRYTELLKKMHLSR